MTLLSVFTTLLSRPWSAAMDRIPTHCTSWSSIVVQRGSCGYFCWNVIWHHTPSARRVFAAFQILQKCLYIKRQITPIPTSAHKNAADFVQPLLETCTHVLVRKDTVKATLTQSCNGSFRITKRTAKPFTVFINGQESRIAIDSLKPAFITQGDLTSPPPIKPVDNSIPLTVRHISKECVNLNAQYPPSRRNY